MRKIFLSMCLFIFSINSSIATAEEWPAKTITVISPWAAGSTPDFIARVVGEELGKQLKQTVIIENKTGASGNIGTNAIAKAEPDGYTIGVSIAGPLAINPLLFDNIPYKTDSDFEFITIAVNQPSILVVNESFPADNLEDLLALLKKHPEQYSFSSVGVGSVAHLSMQALASAVKAQPVHIPYAGSGAAVLAIMQGEVDMAILPAAAVSEYIAEGKIKGLATTSAERPSLIPDLPTLTESNLNIKSESWIGFLAPKGTPQQIVDLLRENIHLILSDEMIIEKLATQYMVVDGSNEKEFRKRIQDEVALWGPIIKENNIER